LDFAGNFGIPERVNLIWSLLEFWVLLEILGFPHMVYWEF